MHEVKQFKHFSIRLCIVAIIVRTYDVYIIMHLKILVQKNKVGSLKLQLFKKNASHD